MKQAYSTVKSNLWKVFKKQANVVDEKSFTEVCMIAYAGAMVELRKKHPYVDIGSRNHMIWDLDCFYYDMLSLFLWKYRKMKHYFLDEGVADFCITSVKDLSGEYAKELPDCDDVLPPRISPDDFFSKNEKGLVSGGFCIHFPSNEKQRSVVVVPKCVIPCNSDYRLYYDFCATDGVDSCLMQKANKQADIDNEADGNPDLPKLICGLSLYMSAFPEYIQTADDIKHIKRYKGASFTLSRSSVMVDEIKNSLSPHFRRGHFRLLSSDRYKNKKGQVVFIKGCFVRGKAYSVKKEKK